ncbi:MAG: metal ABC transporter ATP-binding protein [Oscillospiraceae bacterium]|nr:metal ABC transporter ATP-binding protein [Oscillospiraceae bacterium]
MKNKACGLHCIRIIDLSVKSGGSLILDKVNLHIHCGELTVIIGRNGAGKTTLLKAILKEKPYTGTISFDSHAQHTGTANRSTARPEKSEPLRIGYVPQSLNMDASSPASVYDLCASYVSDIPVFLFKSKALAARIEAQLEMFDAKNLIDRRVCELSGGELQRVLLAVATMSNPKLLLLDEPVSGIDMVGMESFYKTICRLKDEFDLAVILVSHDLDMAARYADRVALLNKTIEASGSVSEVYNSPEFKKTFGRVSY